MSTSYICFRGGSDNEIVAVCDNENRAKEVCCQTFDRYLALETNTDYGRDIIPSDELAIYNVDGNFFNGFTEAEEYTKKKEKGE